MTAEPADPTPIAWQGEDGRLLASLRQRFLAGAPGPDYWDPPRRIELYDRTFGVRIRWKWEWALAQAERRLAPTLRPGEAVARTCVDFGAGTAVASRAWFERFPPQPGDRLVLVERSGNAARYGAERLRAELGPLAAALSIEIRSTPPAEPGALWLLSHVLTELEPEPFEQLLALLGDAAAVLLVEPGTRTASARLVALRERLRTALPPVYPCPQRSACPLADPQRYPGEWCHLFAPPAAEAFTSNHWRQVSRELDLDLRSLPLSVLFLCREPGPEPPPDSLRLLGRPKAEKGRLLLDACGSGEFQRLRLLDRDARELAKALRSGTPQHPLLGARIEDGRLLDLEPR